MRRKGFLIAFFALIVILKFVSAQETSDAEKYNKAFQCLEDEIRKTPTLTLQQSIFSMLAGSGGSRVATAVQGAKMEGQDCWPKEGCTVKDTAQVAIAYKRQNKNTNGIISWLKNQTSIPKELKWYLQIVIDENKPASCVVGYDGAEYQANIADDGYSITAPNGLGSCLSVQPTTYWLSIADNCVEKEFSVSCSKSTQDFSKFKTAFLYKDVGGDTTYVSQTTKSSGPGERHLAQIDVKCFKKDASSTGCDYESTLWATAALYDKNEEIKDFVVYLKALHNSPANQKYFPEAFLIYLTGRDNEFFANVIDKRINARWDISGSPYSTFYDTALGILALGGKDSPEIASTASYLFEEGVQTTQGCWNNNDLSDTAFLLYALGVGKTTTTTGGGGVITFPDGNETNVTNGSGTVNPPFIDSTQCEDAGLYCAPSQYDCLVAGGLVEASFNCGNFGQKCCTVSVEIEQTCSDKGGKVCKSEEKCSSSTVSTSDGACCLDVCQAVGGQQPETNGGTTYIPPTEEKSYLWLIVTLIALILVVALLIVYRNKIQLWWLKRKGTAKSSRLPPGPMGGASPPGFRPGPPRFGPPPTRPMPPVQRPSLRTNVSPQRAPASNDKEMDETLRKLKRISEGK